MASATIDEAKIEISIDKASIDGIKKDLEKIRENTGKTFLKTFKEGNWLSIGAQFRGTVKNLFVDFAKGTKSVGLFSDMLNISVGNMDALLQSAEDFGLEINEAGNAFVDIQKNAFEFITKGSGPFAELAQSPLFDANRLTDSKGQLSDINAILCAVSDAMEGMGDRQAAALAGRAGINDPKMIAFLRQGSDSIKNLSLRAGEFGTRTDEDVYLAKELSKALYDIEKNARRGLIPVFRMITPLLIGIANGTRSLERHFMVIIPLLIFLAGCLGKAFAPKVVTIATRLSSSVKALAAALNMAVGKFALLAGAFLIIGLVLEDLFVWMDGGESAFEEYWEAMLGSPEEGKAKLSELLNMAKETMSMLITVAEYLGPVLILGKIITAVEALTAVMSAFGIAAAVSVGWVVAALLLVGAVVVGLVLYWDEFKEACISALNSIAEWCDSTGQKIKAFFDDLFGGISEKFAAIKDSIFGWTDKFSLTSVKETIFPSTMPGLSSTANKFQTNNNVKIDAKFNIDGSKNPQETANKINAGMQNVMKFDGLGNNTAYAT